VIRDSTVAIQRISCFESACSAHFVADVFWCYMMERHWIYCGRAMRAPLETTSTVLRECSVMAALSTARCVSTDRSVQFIQLVVGDIS